MRVIVTGGAGFIGSNLVRALVAGGQHVVVVDNLAATWSLRVIEDVADQIEFVHGDVRLAEDLERVGPGPFDRVYHLAASFANELSMEYPTIDMRSNIEGTLNVLAMARRVGCGLFVYTGSSSSYGDVPVPFEEDGATRPYTPYAISKQVGETYVRTSGLPYAIFRLFNVYGPGDPPGRYRNAVPNMMRALDGDDGTIRVFGRDATRDFTYVDDVVRALLDAPRALGQVVNVGTGQEISIVELARRILRLFDLPESRMSFEEPRTWDRVVRRCASVERLRALYGWVPSTPLADGLRQAARWMHAAGYVGRAPA
jgi:UDP-glucose 4-epimerase